MQHNSVEEFDPNGEGIQGNLFGLPFDVETAALVVVPIPWEVTVSYHSGTALGPAAIREASTQVDLCIKDIANVWKLGIAMMPVPDALYQQNKQLRELAATHIASVRAGANGSTENPLLDKINEACENLNIYVKSTTQKLLRQGKMVALLGGDHSAPLGFIRALAEKYESFAILQIDAHADLRKAYEGFTYSHASVMQNALKIPAVKRLVQVGIRDFCEEELTTIERAGGKIRTFFDADIRSHRYEGKSWNTICQQIIKELPQFVYLSFDIDGLDPKLCPGTGTPVPGGLEFDEAIYLIKTLVRSGRTIIGLDINEVAPQDGNDWDANVGARLLYLLSNWMAVSQQRLKAR